jgi:hypothetical protein
MDTKKAVKLVLVLASAGFMFGATILILSFLIMRYLPNDVPPETKLSNWIEVQCIDQLGNIDTHQVPVPKFEDFSEDFVDEYYEEAGKQFCEAIEQDLSQYQAWK